MTIPSQQYAALSDDAYKDRAVGRRAPGQQEVVTIDGQRYAVLEHIDNKSNGYQGTIYRREATGEIVVAHRGTEQAIKDGLITDGGMVVSRTNRQAPDALALTQHALDYANEYGKQSGHTPQVTVTGHSLGGTLAQICAHHYSLKGETFNAYGAVSLEYRIPEGGNSVVNHVMAADPVSSASPHFGQVRIYAKPEEISTLSRAGYSNSRFNSLIPDSPVVAAGLSMGSHKLGNFLGDQSVLHDPQARQRADDNKRMIDEYRDDIGQIRSHATILTRSGVGLGRDAIDLIRGPLPPGEPARREAQEHRNEHSSLRIDSSGHPGNGLFEDAQRGVNAQAALVERASPQQRAQLSAALALEMHAAGGQRIDTVLTSGDAARTFAVQGRVEDPAHLRVHVETAMAMNVPLEQSSQRVAESASRQALAMEQQVQVQQHGPRAMG